MADIAKTKNRVNKKLASVLRKYAKQLLKDYKKKLTAGNVSSSGGLLSTESALRITNQGIAEAYEIIFFIEDYWRYVEDGRSPGTFPPVEAMLNYVRNKPIIPEPFTYSTGRTIVPTENQLAFLIGRKIKEDGIPMRPYLFETVKQNESALIADTINAFGGDEEENLRIEISGIVGTIKYKNMKVKTT